MARTTKTNKKRSVKRRTVKRRSVKRCTVKRFRVNKRSGGGKDITHIVQGIDQNISLLTNYIDDWVGKQTDMNDKQCEFDHIYSDHVQLKRDVDDFTVFTNNVSFMLMFWAHLKTDDMQYASYYDANNRPKKFKPPFFINNGPPNSDINDQNWKSERFMGGNLPSEALLVNALVNSKIGQDIAKPGTTDSSKSFLHKFLAEQVEQVTDADKRPSIVCLQEAIVDYIKDDENIKEKYKIAYSKTGPEGSAILIDQEKFECISPTGDECKSNEGPNWAICGKEGRAWSFVVVKSNTNSKQYLIINIHGTHPKTDADHEYPKGSDKKFGKHQVWCFQQWLQDTFNITETPDKETFEATIHGKPYDDIDKVILAGDFNDEIGSCETNQWRGQIRKALNMSPKVFKLAYKCNSGVLWNRLGADVRKHDKNPKNIIPTNGHLALGSEMRAAGDMILCAVRTKASPVTSSMELASSGLPKDHYFGEKSQVHLGRGDIVSFNKPYIKLDDTNTRYTKLAHFANRTNHQKHGDKYCVLWMIDQNKVKEKKKKKWVCRQEFDDEQSHGLNYIGITENGKVLNGRESITNYLLSNPVQEETAVQLANFSCVRVIGGTITQECLNKANELLQQTDEQCMICWDGDPVSQTENIIGTIKKKNLGTIKNLSDKDTTTESTQWTDGEIQDKLRYVYTTIIEEAKTNDKTTINIAPLSSGVMSGTEHTTGLASKDDRELCILRNTVHVLNEIVGTNQELVINIYLFPGKKREFEEKCTQQQIELQQRIHKNIQLIVKSLQNTFHTEKPDEDAVSVIAVGRHHVLCGHPNGASGIAKEYYEHYAVQQYGDDFKEKMRTQDVAFNEHTKCIEAFSPDFNVPPLYYQGFLKYYTADNTKVDKFDELKQFARDIRKEGYQWENNPNCHFTSVLVKPEFEARPKQAFVLPNNIDPYPYPENKKKELMDKYNVQFVMMTMNEYDGVEPMGDMDYKQHVTYRGGCKKQTKRSNRISKRGRRNSVKL